MDITVFSALFTYFSILVFIGLSAYKKQHTSEDFLLGGRSLNYWLTAIAAHASDMSGWLFIGFPAAVYTNGVPECWAAIGLWICMFLSWQYIAPRLRIATQQYNALTISSYFSKRFNDESGLIRITTACMSLLFFMFYVSAGLRTMGIVSNVAFGIDYQTAILTSTFVVITYTTVGGFLAVAWTDFFQGMFLLLMILIVPSYAYMHLGSLQTITTMAHLKHIPLTLLKDFSLQSIMSALVIAASWGLGYFGQPHILNKFMSIKDPNQIRKAQLVGMTWQFLILLAAIAVGLIGIGFFSTGLVNSEHIFIAMVKHLFNPFFAYFILCSMLAAAISTIDSQVLVFASVLSEDIYKQLINPQATQKAIMNMSRIGVLLISILSLIIAHYEIRSIYALVKYAWSGLGSSFGPLLIASFYSNHITRQGALAGIITGGFVSAMWHHMTLQLSSDPIIPGFLASFVAIFLVSWLTKSTSSYQI